MSVADLKPARLGKKRSKSMGSGGMAERLFYEEALTCGYEISSPAFGSDTGVDYDVLSKTAPFPEDRIQYRVQVSMMSETNKGYGGRPDGYGPSWSCTKYHKKIRDDVDILAILIHNHNSGDTKNVNTRIAGKQDIWFIIPRLVFVDDRMWSNYKLDTNKMNWQFNIKKPLLPPLDKARDAFDLFRRPNVNGQVSVDGFFAD